MAMYFLAAGLVASVLGLVRSDWSWHLVAAFCGFSSAMHWGILCADHVRAGAEGLLRWCPAWMSTRWGQWVAGRVPFVGRRWTRNMVAAGVMDADLDAAMWGIRLQIAMNCFANSNDDPREMAQVMAMWCGWRSSAERAHRCREEQAGRRLDLPPWLAGMPRMEDLHFGAGTSATH